MLAAGAVCARYYSPSRGAGQPNDRQVARPPASIPSGHANQPTTRPIAAVTHVLIISIDGLRPDLLTRGDVPNLRRLLDSSCYTMWARTVKEAYTLPAHVSMLTGVVSDRHGVTWNRYIEDSYPNVPTLFELAKQAGLTTAMVSAKMKFRLSAQVADH
jgi:hypothetical protein